MTFLAAPLCYGCVTGAGRVERGLRGGGDRVHGAGAAAERPTARQSQRRPEGQSGK